MHLSFLEEKKKLVRDFDEKQQEANETVRTGSKSLFLVLGFGLFYKYYDFLTGNLFLSTHLDLDCL